MSRLIEYIRRWLDAWRADTERINEYNRAACLQREAEYREWLIWRQGGGIVQ